ncbi:hypothetical protein DVH05_012160 [Phytophthora capsici]|nr:hypothetical protein DVH05_012160 [Phytophthora capsici]
MPPPVSEDKYSSALYPTSCASQALQQLKFRSSDLDMPASAAAVLLCEQTTSTSPSKCLADIQHERTLSTKLRLQLCQQATTDSPQLCLRALRKFVNTQRMEISDAVLACQQTKLLAPAECVMELLKVSVSVIGRVAARVCQAAVNLKPARCFMASPVFYDDELKVLLCSQAESSAPASCVNTAITRFGNQPAMKVSLCRGAISVAPAACAIEAPLAMDGASVVVLCRFASSTAPARCAQEIPTSLHVPWHHVAQVCANATSTIPGRCLARYVYRSRLLLDDLDHEKLIGECRFAVARPTALAISKASYNCPELRPMCPMQLELNILDQYGDTMDENYNGDDVVYIRAVVTETHDSQQVYMRRNQPVLQGSSYATISNGSAVFSNLIFTGAGEFVLTFRAGEHVTEEVARVHVHPDVAAEALQSRCDNLFTRFQCSAASPPHLRHGNDRNELQMLLLPLKFQLNSISCADYWANNIGGLVFSGFSPPSHVLYTLPRPLYELLMYVNISSLSTLFMTISIVAEMTEIWTSRMRI